MSLEITGKLLEKYDTQVVSDRFKKREFVLELVDETPNGNFTNYAKMQLVQNKTDLLDQFKVGDTIKATFNIKGNRYDKNGITSYFTNLDVWRLEPGQAGGNDNGGGAYNQSAYADNSAAPTGGYNSGNYGGGNAGNYSNNAGFSNTAAAPASPAPASQSGGNDDLPF